MSGDPLTNLRVLAHPLRLRMLSLLTGCDLSAAEMGRELGVSQALASYHLRQLEEAGVTEVAEVRAKRGGREKVYRVSPGSTRASGDPEAFALYAEAVATELRRRVARVVEGPGRLAVDAELWVDPAEWTEALGSVREAATRLHEAARPPRSPGTVRVSASVMMFRMEPE